MQLYSNPYYTGVSTLHAIMLVEATVVQDIFDKLIEETCDSVVDYQLQYANQPEKIVYYEQNPVFIGYGYDSVTQKVIQMNEPDVSDSSSEIHPIYYCYHIEPMETSHTHNQPYGMMTRMRYIEQQKEYLKSDPIIIDMWPAFYCYNRIFSDAWQKRMRIMMDMSHEFQHIYDWYVSSSQDIHKVITIQDIGYTDITVDFFRKYGIYFLETSDIKIISKILYLFSDLETNAINKQIEAFIRMNTKEITNFFNSKSIYRRYNNEMLAAEFVDKYVYDANIGHKAYQDIMNILESKVKNNSYILVFALLTAMVAHKLFDNREDVCDLFGDFSLCNKAYSKNLEMTAEIHYAIETAMNDIRAKFEEYYRSIIETAETYLKKYGCFDNILNRKIIEKCYLQMPTLNSHIHGLNEQVERNLITDGEMWHRMNIELFRSCSDFIFALHEI